MRHRVVWTVVSIVLTAIALAAIFPAEKNLRLGQDLAGGFRLLYAVDTGGRSDVVSQMIPVLKDRIDPNGTMEIGVVAQGSERIEITMPLPSEAVQKLKAEFEAKLAQLDEASLTAEEFERLMASDAADRAAAIERAAQGDPARRQAIEDAAALYDRAQELQAEYRGLFAEVQAVESQLRSALSRPEEERDAQIIEMLELSVDAKERTLDPVAKDAAAALVEYESRRELLLTAALTAEDVRAALRKSPQEKKLYSQRNRKTVVIPGPRDAAVARLKEQHPAQAERIDEVVAAFSRYESQRRSLDDPSDVIRILQGAGVLEFRITARPGEHPEEDRLRTELKSVGPRNVVASDARWCKINQIDNWYDNDPERLQSLLDDPPGFFAAFAQGVGYVVEEFDGEFYMLCWDRRGLRLTAQEGEWVVARTYQGVDQLGRPAINFEMDALGADLLGRLTDANKGNQMAVLLDDQVYTAPTLQGRISSSGQISGEFRVEELDYIIRVLSAGALQARLSPEPISVNQLGPELGADNLRQGLFAGWIALAAISTLMIFYYFGNGAISVFALIINATLILGAMALNRSSFTLPGIAGIVLTFGMAVDANVLIFERIREERFNGADLRTSIRLGYSRALSAIVDGNITNLIVCVVLGSVGTPEIKGFAITLGIGVVTTLFTALVVTRVFYSFLAERGPVRAMPMLATAIPAIHRALEPRIDWLRMRPVFWVVSVGLITASFTVIYVQRDEVLDTEFRGGTAVTIRLKTTETGERVTLTKAQVEERVAGIAESDNEQLHAMRSASVVPMNPGDDGVTSDTFIIKTVVSDAGTVQSELARVFSDVVDEQPPVRFDGQEAAGARDAPVFPITDRSLGRSIDRPELGAVDVPDFVGGVAIVLDNMTPTPSVASLASRIQEMRSDPRYVETLGRQVRIVRLGGTDTELRAAVVLVNDPNISYWQNQDRWETDLRDTEWGLVVDALSRVTTLASVQSFSPAVAATFQTTAIIAVLLSAVLIVIYVWVRFGSVRYSLAAIVCTIHDCIIVVGLIAVAEVIYDRMPGVASSLGLRPFKIDLNLVAAVLTIMGYSLNDTIVVMDRIRENRGKLPYASRRVVNLSINQTMSRTVMTSGTTLVACIVLYVVGGEGVREFAYALTLGILVGTYSSVAVASPLVWVHKADRSNAELEAAERAAGVLAADGDEAA